VTILVLKDGFRSNDLAKAEKHLKIGLLQRLKSLYKTNFISGRQQFLKHTGMMHLNIGADFPLYVP
jgi:hypothetical protein